MRHSDGDTLTPEQKAALHAFLAHTEAQPSEGTSMDDNVLADIEREVIDAIAADPHAAYLLLISVAQAWGQCLYDLGFGMDTLDENNAAMDEAFRFVPEALRTAIRSAVARSPARTRNGETRAVMIPDNYNTPAPAGPPHGDAVGPGTGTWLTTTEAAQRLGLQPGSLRMAITRGRLAAHRLNPRRILLVRLEEVERYRREHLGQRSWQHRRDPDYQPSPAARASKRYRERKKAHVQHNHDEVHP